MYKMLALSIATLLISNLILSDPIETYFINNGNSVEVRVGHYKRVRAANQGWITFYANKDDMIDLDINRIDPQLDLYAVLSYGDIRGLDDEFISLRSLDSFPILGTTKSSVTIISSDLSLALVDIQDDTEDYPITGAFGDPRFTLTAKNTGIYTAWIVSYNGFGRAKATLTITPPLKKSKP